MTTDTLYDLRWHNADSHLIGSHVYKDKALATQDAYDIFTRPGVSIVVMWVGARPALRLTKQEA